MKILRTWTLVAGILAVSGNATAEVSSSGKGVAGGALLGAELTVFTEALLGVQSGWAFAVGAGAGAAAGGAGGFLVEDSGSAAVPMLMLTTGMALIIPATIVTMSSTRYRPPDVGQDQATLAQQTKRLAAAHGPTLSQGTLSQGTSSQGTLSQKALSQRDPSQTNLSGSIEPQSNQTRLLHAESALRFPMSAISLDVWQTPTLRLSLPAVEIRDSYTAQEVAMFGVEQKTEFRIPVFDLVF